MGKQLKVTVERRPKRESRLYKDLGRSTLGRGKNTCARLERVEELVRKTRIYRETSKGQVVFSLLMVIIVGDTPTNIDSIRHSLILSLF